MNSSPTQSGCEKIGIIVLTTIQVIVVLTTDSFNFLVADDTIAEYFFDEYLEALCVPFTFLPAFMRAAYLETQYQMQGKRGGTGAQVDLERFGSMDGNDFINEKEVEQKIYSR